jgi:hypothetical protein
MNNIKLILLVNSKILASQSEALESHICTLQCIGKLKEFEKLCLVNLQKAEYLFLFIAKIQSVTMSF